MIKVTPAQEMLMAFGMNVDRVFVPHKLGRQAHATKKGPGRFHKQGLKKHSRPERT